MNRWAFRTLAERAETFVSHPDDRNKLEQAVALDGLHFGLLQPDQCARLALAVERAADELRLEFRNGVAAYDRDFADRLDSLRLALSDLTGS